MIYLNNFSALSCLGQDEEESKCTLNNNQSKYLTKRNGYLIGNQSAFLGKLTFVKEIPSEQPNYCRNIQLVNLCLQKIDELILDCIKVYGKNKVGVVIGTSTSAISDVEYFAQKHYISKQKIPADERVYEVGCISEYIKKRYDLSAPCYTIATACSSSGLALISACQLIKSGICDVVISGGTDSLSKITVNGFNSLGVLSKDLCIPFHKNRHGMNIGEGTALTIVSREKITDNPISLIGYAASTDGYHMSTPEPNGIYASKAMTDAMNMAHISKDEIGYINMHGTGTLLNDSMEGKAIKQIFNDSVPVSSSKHLTGHTLGAASIIEAYVCNLILTNNLALPYHNYKSEDYSSEFGEINLITSPNIRPKTNIIMSNSFAFGGNNVSLIFKR